MRAGLIAALLVSPVCATAQTPPSVVSASNVASVVTALQAAGYRAAVEKDKEGETYVASAANGSDFSISFYTCDDEKKKIGCKTLLFKTWWKPKPYLTAALANTFNLKAMFGRAYVNEDKEFNLELPVTTVGGMSFETFKDVVSWWSVSDADLDRLVDEAAKASETRI